MTHPVRAGDDVTLAIQLSDEEGNAVDLNQTEITWGLATSSAGDPKLTKTQGDGVTITDAVNGQIEIELLPADTAPLDRGGYYHEIQVVDDNDQVTTFVPDTRIKIEETVIDSE